MIQPAADADDRAGPAGTDDVAAPGDSFLRPRYRVDLRRTPPDVFEDLSDTDWSRLSWRDLGEPYRVTRMSRHRERWEEEHGREMPVPVQWERFNRAFHDLFSTDVPRERRQRAGELVRRIASLDLPGAWEAARRLTRISIWNHVHRVEDAVWDPRGKRALFRDLDVDRPEILFLGAAEGYEAMQLLAMYPGGRAVLVDYDEFCRTDRFGDFPRRYPFLGTDPATGGETVHRRGEMEIDYVVSDIRDLETGPRFDIVLSVGLLEHFPDEYKPMVFDWHRRFLKPGGYAVLTTPRRQVRSRLFYLAMSEIMNYGYRELMDARQLGLYAFENGFEILRCGYIKAHNGLVARAE